MHWTLTKAQNNFSDVIRRAIEEGPQRIEGSTGAVVVMLAAEYDRLTDARPSFKDFLLSAPDLSQLDLQRDCASTRELDL